eukprot:15464026-Heterocapsa_arctica.AAC.1
MSAWPGSHLEERKTPRAQEAGIAPPSNRDVRPKKKGCRGESAYEYQEPARALCEPEKIPAPPTHGSPSYSS